MRKACTKTQVSVFFVVHVYCIQVYHKHIGTMPNQDGMKVKNLNCKGAKGEHTAVKIMFTITVLKLHVHIHLLILKLVS